MWSARSWPARSAWPSCGSGWPGSSHADGRLAYLPEQAALDLRARLLAAHHGLDPATPEPAEQILTSVPTGRLVGSVPASGASVLGALALAASRRAIVVLAHCAGPRRRHRSRFWSSP